MHWFWKCNFWKNSLSPFRGRWGQEVIFEVAEAKFWISSSFDRFWFRIFVVLGFEVVWPQRPRRPQKGLSEFFQKLHFWNQCIKLRKMSYSSALWSKFSLNLSTEEVWDGTKENFMRNPPREHTFRTFAISRGGGGQISLKLGLVRKLRKHLRVLSWSAKCLLY